MIDNKSIKLRNLIFPIWALLFFPATWIIVIPANYFIDWLVVKLTLKKYKVKDAKKIFQNIELKVCLFGFLADIIGAIIVALPSFLRPDSMDGALGVWWQKNISIPIEYNAFSSIYAFVWIGLCIILTGVLIYKFNYKIVFKKVEIDDVIKKKVALSLAIFTAPYLFYFPAGIFFV